MIDKGTFSQIYHTYVSGQVLKYDDHFTKISDKARSSGILKKNEILLYEPKHSVRMYRSSCLIFIAGICSYFYFMPYCSDLTLHFSVVGLTSINHWRHPIFGIRRNIDLICAQYSILYHLYCAFYELGWGLTSWIFLLGFLINIVPLYILAMYNGLKHNHDLSSKCHSFMHICGIFWTIFLYFGLKSSRSCEDNVNECVFLSNI